MRLIKGLLITVVTLTSAGMFYISGWADDTHSNSATTISNEPLGEQSKSYIIQGAKPAHLRTVVMQAGGNVENEYPIINAVSAMLTQQQVAIIQQVHGLRIQDDRTITSMNKGKSQYAPGIQAKLARINNKISEQISAHKLHDMGITGNNVTVAVIDSGVNLGGKIGKYLFRDSRNKQRVSIKYDAIRGHETYYYNDDRNGHGTHVAGLVASSLKDDDGNFNGIAPDVHLLSVRAFNAHGESSYSRVLDALNWVFNNRYRFKIRVVNMSLGVEASSHYWEDPINQAVMRLWDAGIVVVSSAGNNGRDVGITVPGNNPYVITVGALSDHSSPLDFSDDRIATFSSKGPTVEGFVKPEVVAFGVSIASKMDMRYFRKRYKLNKLGRDYAEVSGTSQAAAIVSGVAALIISNQPNISPNDVKCKIMASAKSGYQHHKLAFSPFEQGSGMVNAYDAVVSNASNCANVNLNIKQDLLGESHFAGPSRLDAQGNAYIALGNGEVLSQGVSWGTDAIDLNGISWGDSITKLQGVGWSDGTTRLQGVAWGGGRSAFRTMSWTNALIDLQGISWGDSLLQLQGTSWGNGISLQSSDLDLEPIDPNIIIEVSENGWQ
ncbi:MAG: S8 family peptidase [Glaciecola sp.]